MRTISNKALSAFMALVLAVGMMPLPAFASNRLEPAEGVFAQSEPSIALVGEITDESTVLKVNSADLPSGARLYVSKFTAEQAAKGEMTGYGAGEKLFDSNDASWFTFEEGEKQFYIGNSELSAGDRVIAYVLSNWTIQAQSEPVIVGSSGGSSGSATPTRQQIIDACSISMTGPNGDGTVKLSDTSAQLKVQLHESVDFARVSVIAYPKAASFDPDNSSYNKTVFSRVATKNAATELGDITATFDLTGLDTTYNLVGYLYFQVPPEDSDDYQYKTSSSFALVDESGQTTENYTYPKASITESALPTGASAMHVSLTGDDRLFKLANDTASEPTSSQFKISFMVVEYDASITRFDMGEDSYTTLYSEEATEAFTDKEIDLAEPLTKGKKVRALCYWSQYDGDKAAIPVPRGVDYDGLDSEAIVVTDDAPAVVTTPSVTVNGPLTTSTNSFTVTAKHLPEGALMFVDKFAEGEAIEHDYTKIIATFSPYANPSTAPVNGANAVTLGSPLSAGERVVAFVLSGGNVVAQSDSVTVVEAAQAGSVSIADTTVLTSAKGVKVVLSADAPDDAAVLLKSFEQGGEVAYDKGTAHGYFSNLVKGENDLQFALNADKLPAGGSLVAFLMSGGSVAAQSAPVPIAYVASAPTAEIGLDGNDVELTQGDKFVSFKWSVDPNASDVTWKLYQFEGEELDEANATVMSSGALVVSKYHYSDNTYASLGGELVAGAKLQMVVTADGVKGYSNTMTVGATPAWAKVVPTVAFDQSAAKTDAKSVKLIVDYPEEYKSLGDEFFCNVSVYQYPGSYTDEDFEDEELDENPSIARVVAGRNSSAGETNGALELTFSDSTELVAGNRLIAKIRLPQAERQDHDSMWEDYLSWSIPVISADSSVPAEALYLYNLDEDTAKGEKIRIVADSLGLAVRDLTNDDLSQLVGYVIGKDGYEAIDEAYVGDGYDAEYMLMANLSEASLDRLLAAMREEGVTVGAKGINTETNETWTVEKLIGDIVEEHESTTAWVELNSLVNTAKALDAATYGSQADWAELQSSISSAQNLLTSGEEKEASEYQEAYSDLERLYLSVSGLKKVDGRVEISAELQDDGTYTLTAQVVGASEAGIDYEFTWNDAASTTGNVLYGVPASKVGARSATATSADGFGSIDGQLQQPDAVEVMAVSENKGSITVSWTAEGADFNQPAPEKYIAELFGDVAAVSTSSDVFAEPAATLASAGSSDLGIQSSTPIGSIETSDTTVTFTGLDEGDYIVKVYAVNQAGRSDKVSVQATVRESGGSAAGDPSDDEGQSQTMHRLYNPNSGEHFYTASEFERDHLRAVGWRYEGTAWTAPKESDVPVYRLYNPNAGDHHYTTSAAERDMLKRAGWNDEGTGWYSAEPEGAAVYRLYNPNAYASGGSGAHHYTTKAAERDHLVDVGWRAEGTGWYGVAAS